MRRKVLSGRCSAGFVRLRGRGPAGDLQDQHELAAAAWRDAAKQDPNYLASETPLFVGRAVAALSADPDLFKKSGRVFSSWRLSDEYPFTDADGFRPHWGRHFAATYGNPLKYCDDAFYEHWIDPAVDALFPDWP